MGLYNSELRKKRGDVTLAYGERALRHEIHFTMWKVTLAQWERAG